MELVGFDTHILIWGVQKTSRQTQQDMIPKTERFFKHLDDNQIKVIIPSVVLSEFLMPIPAKEMGSYLHKIEEKFMVIPYDAMAAIEFAKIWQSKQEDDTIQALRHDGLSKHHLKVDGMIVATALTRKASCIYSHDSGLKKFASGYIEVKEIPFLPQPEK
jgi:predicted nucleic acid-binding protein